MHNAVAQSLAADFAWVKEDPSEIGGRAAQCRYVATLNPAASVAEFVSQAEAFGYDKSTARIQFWKIRRDDFWTDPNFYSVDPEGRAHELTH